MRYPVTLANDDNDTILVTFPDVPEAVTFGDTVDEALARAPDALLTIFDALMKDRRDIPLPSAVDGPAVEVPALEATKIDLYRTMRAEKVNKAELGRRLKVHLPQIDRMLNVRHASQLEQIESAFRALGKRLEIRVLDAGAPSREAGIATLKVVRAKKDERVPVPGAIMSRARAERSARGGTRHFKRSAKKR